MRVVTGHAHRSEMGRTAVVRERRMPGGRLRPAVDGFFWIAGQGGYGIETSPAMGRLSASLAANKGIPRDLADFGVDAQSLSPARFAQR